MLKDNKTVELKGEEKQLNVKLNIGCKNMMSKREYQVIPSSFSGLNRMEPYSKKTTSTRVEAALMLGVYRILIHDMMHQHGR
jgi:hypothetical protein